MHRPRRSLSLRDLQLPTVYEIAGFLAALVASVLLTYVVRARARRAQLFDHVDGRKVHSAQIPRLGGVAVFTATLLTLGVSLGSRWTTSALRPDQSFGLASLLLGAIGMHFVGLFDDLRSMRARWKLCAQIAIAVGVFVGGVQIRSLGVPILGVMKLPGYLALLATVAWLVGITNAFNLIDGLDGLASGTAMFALATMFIVARLDHQTGAAFLIVVLGGATCGFLAFNFHPASIFLGDSGSMFLGFMLAGIGLLSFEKSPTMVAVAIPVVALGLPVIDTSVSIVRRFLRGQPIFSPDKGHVHHRLLVLGHSPQQATLLLYAASAVLALSAMVLVEGAAQVALVLIMVGLLAAVAIRRLRYHEFEELARAIRRGTQQRQVIRRSVQIREASARLAPMQSLSDVFRALGETFAADEVQRAEVRLRPSFLYQEVVTSLDRRLEDDVAVWTWSRSELTEPSLWEIKLPLANAAGSRIGSLVLWQDGLAGETALSHMHAVARDLRCMVQRKVIELWSDANLVDEPADTVVADLERVISLPALSELHRRRGEIVVEREMLSGPERGADRRPEGIRWHLG